MPSTTTIFRLTYAVTSTLAAQPLLHQLHTLLTPGLLRIQLAMDLCRHWSRAWRASRDQAARAEAPTWQVLDGSLQRTHLLPLTAPPAMGILILTLKPATPPTRSDRCSMPALPPPSLAMRRMAQLSHITRSPRVKRSCGRRINNRFLLPLTPTELLLGTLLPLHWQLIIILLSLMRTRTLTLLMRTRTRDVTLLMRIRVFTWLRCDA